MQKLILTIFVLSILATNTTFAEASTPHFEINELAGLGKNTCNKFLSDLQEPDSSGMIKLYNSWNSGFESGLNVSRAVSSTPYNLSPTDFDSVQQMAFLRNYCSNHPEELYSEATLALLEEIIKHQSATKQ